MTHPRIVASDYKGKWFVLEDAKSETDMGERPEVNMDYILGIGLSDHVESCMYYGIPAYIGSDRELIAKITAIQDELEAKSI